MSYPANTECVWLVHNAPGNRISVSFSDFEITESENCNLDYLEIRETDGIGKLLGVFCGNSISDLISSKPMWMKFRSSQTSTNNPKGFMASFAFVSGNELFGESGEIASPLFPKLYRNIETITWTINVDYGWSIQMHITEFHFDGRREHCFANLKVFSLCLCIMFSENLDTISNIFKIV